MGSNDDKNSSTNIIDASKDKLDDLASERTKVLENLCPSVRKRVETLQEIQSEHDELEKKFFEERAALEAKYQKLYEPLYTKRYEIVNGVNEVEGNTIEAESEDKGVPEFWLTVLKNNVILAGEITEHDEAALKFLKDIKWSKVDNLNGFKLEFHFDTTNPYFKNSVLTKTYDMIDEEDEPVLEKAIGTEIEWYPGKCLTKKISEKKTKKGSEDTEPSTKTEGYESFFNFFSPPVVAEEEDEDTDDEDDVWIWLIIKDKIIPHAVSWFTGEAPQDEFVEIDYDDELDEEDDEEVDGNKDEDKTEKKKSGEVLSGEGN
ncbi:Unknown protein [Striga hermonthica]|uniref:Uncharacterized protein n=1 Tax=Striga hermonthica TaxID=68872 RepID=A0A9N7MVU2_STRHE|nr:Unknown protein [Striga hermonthica]